MQRWIVHVIPSTNNFEYCTNTQLPVLRRYDSGAVKTNLKHHRSGFTDAAKREPNPAKEEDFISDELISAAEAPRCRDGPGKISGHCLATGRW